MSLPAQLSLKMFPPMRLPSLGDAKPTSPGGPQHAEGISPSRKTQILEASHLQVPLQTREIEAPTIVFASETHIPDVLKSIHEIRRGPISRLELRRRRLSRNRFDPRAACRFHLASIRKYFRFRRGHSAGRFCLWRLSAYGRDCAFFSSDESGGSVRAFRRIGSRNLQWLSNSPGGWAPAGRDDAE